MKQHIAYERALRALREFDRQIAGAVTVSGNAFTEAVRLSIQHFADADSVTLLSARSAPLDGSAGFSLPAGDPAGIVGSETSPLWKDLFASGRFRACAKNDGELVSRKYRSWLYIPVSAKKETWIAAVVARRDGKFSEAEQKAAEILAAHYSQSLRNIRARNRKTSRIAEEARHAMLLHTQASATRRRTEIPGLALAMDYSAGTGSDLGKTWKTGLNSLLICTCDLTASDAERQAGMIYLDTWLSVLSRTTMDAKAMIKRINSDMLERPEECYASLALVKHAPEQSALEIAGCGNIGAIHFSHENMDAKIFDFGPAAGIQENAEILSYQVPAGSGDIVCAFTDGITGTRKRNGDLFGAEETAEIIRKHYYLSAPDLAAKILAAVEEKEEKGVNRDDRTVHVLKIE
ncbi:MAG TPA: SpoIIE family protein phosphatase [Treponemataceae bacterium]|nr:SpoIIE family protein phosphatase [Treponemataceae bacterium]